MKTIETGQQKDPMETINQCYKEDTNHRKFFVRTGYALMGAGAAGLLPAVLMPTKETIIAAIVVNGAAAAYIETLQIRRLYKYLRGKGVSKKELQEAYSQIETIGVKTVGEMITAEISGTEPTIELLGKYCLAQRIRATKLFLAERGRLEKYQEFNWLQSIPIPEGLQPTHSDLDEVDRWKKDQDARMAIFVDELSRRENIFIECGRGILPEATRAYLFQDNKDPWKNESHPLLDVMLALKAREKELQPISISNAIAFFQNPDYHYDSIFSAMGKQRIADFFGRTTYFYSGAERIPSEVDRYGVLEPTMITLNSLPEHLWRERFHRTEPFSCIEKIETSAVRLKNIGLELALY